MHFKQVLIPFDCVPPTAGDGPDTVRLAPSIECNLERWDYFVMYHVAFVFLINIIILFLWVNDTIAMAFYWQYGNTMRDIMPAGVAMVEVSVLDMKGYNWEVRDYLKAMMISVQ
jgi:hypothetical protein